MNQEQDLVDATLSLSILVKAIEEDDIKTVKTALDILDISKLSITVSNQLLAKLLAKTTRLKQEAIARALLNKWIEINFMEIQSPIITQLYSVPFISAETLNFLNSFYPDMTFIRHMTSLIDNDSSPEVLQAAIRLTEVFPAQSFDVYEQLLNYCNDQKFEEAYPNVIMMEFVKREYEKVAPYQPKPSWIIELKDEKRVKPTDRDLKTNICTVLRKTESKDHEGKIDQEEALAVLADGLSLADKQRVQEEYNKLDDKSKRELLHMIYHRKRILELADNVELYRIFGPSNIAFNPSITFDRQEDGDPCQEGGGCRMFTCNEIMVFNDEMERLTDELDQEEDFEGGKIDTLAWFRGNCDFCHNKIAHFYYAVRMPLTMGSWAGCYCSWECVHNDDNSQDPLQHRMIDLHEEKMKRIGIYDRS